MEKKSELDRYFSTLPPAEVEKSFSLGRARLSLGEEQTNHRKFPPSPSIGPGTARRSRRRCRSRPWRTPPQTPWLPRAEHPRTGPAPERRYGTRCIRRPPEWLLAQLAQLLLAALAVLLLLFIILLASAVAFFLLPFRLGAAVDTRPGRIPSQELYAAL